MKFGQYDQSISIGVNHQDVDLDQTESEENTRRGQTIVEMSLVLPIFLMLIFAVFEFGRLLYTYAAVTTASREAARYGSAVGDVTIGFPRYKDCVGIRFAAKRIGILAGIQDEDVNIQYDDGTDVYSASCPPTEDVELADRIVVTVSLDYRPVMPLVNMMTFPLISTSARTIIKDLAVERASP